MKKLIRSIAVFLTVAIMLVSCASNKDITGTTVNNLRILNNTIQDTDIVVNLKEGRNPAPYADKIKTTGALNEDGSLDLYIVHTNDVHGRMDSKDGGLGYPTLSAFLQILRQKANGNVLTLEAGDVTHGTNLANFFYGENVVNLLGYMGYDAVTLGNHEFNYGLKQLNTNLIIEIARDAVPVSNNIKLGGKRILPPYRIFDFSGYRVAVIGLTTPSTSTQANPKYVEGLDFETNLVYELEQTVNEVRNKADYVIVLGHIGFDPVGKDNITSATLCRDVKGIDLFVDGHSHTRLTSPYYDGSSTTPIVQTGDYLNAVGVEKLHISADKKVETFDYYLVTKEEFEDPATSSFLSSLGILSKIEDQAVTDYIASKKATLEEVYKKEVANLPVKYDGARAIVRAEQCDLGNMVTTALATAVEADFGILNGGSFRADLGPGVVTVGDINNTLPFNNYVVLSSISGAGIYEALENGYKSYPDLAGGFPQTNLIVTADTSLEPGSRIISVALPDGTEIAKDDTEYKVATNDFMVAGGDGYTQFGKIIRYERQVNEVVIDYLKENYPLNN